MESEKRSGKESLIYLDFNDKIPQEMLADELFIRVANLDDKSPLVQINDMVFKGSNEYSIGTNLFFKKISKPAVSEFPFQAPTDFQLEFLAAETKVINCKQMKVPPVTASLPENLEKIEYNFGWTYEELLEKLEQGTLDLKDMTEPPSNQTQEVLQVAYTEPAEMDISTHTDIESEPLDGNKETTEVTENNEIQHFEEQQEKPMESKLKIAYEKLQQLARRPAKRRIIEETVECDPKYSSSYEYKSIECKVLEPPLFSYFKTCKTLEDYDISDCIDIDRCVRLGIIPPSNNPSRILSENEKKMLLKMENFENLDLVARYLVLASHKEALEKQVNSSSPEENSSKDEFGHTPLETLDIFANLLLSLRKRISKVLIKT